MKKALLIAAVAAIAACCRHSDGVYDVTDYGAKGDSLTLNTEYIQKAIDDAAAGGGGVVYIPNGTFISGTIFLKSNVTLHLAEGATLLGSPRIEDYTELTWGHNVDRQPYHLVCAIDQQNVAIEGRGTIDGNGRHFWQSEPPLHPQWILPKEKKVSPLIEIVRCRNTTIRDVNIKTGGGWNLHVFDCDLVKVQGVNIVNNIFSPNSDAPPQINNEQ